MAIATGTAAVAGILVGMTFTFYPHTGPEYLIIAFGVVIVGGLGSLIGTFYGRFDPRACSNPRRPFPGSRVSASYRLLDPFDRHDFQTNWSFCEGIKGDMDLFRSHRLFGIVLVVLGLITLPYWASRYWVLVVLLFSLNLALSQMWNLLAGYSGLISLGQQAFIGLGGYALAVFSIYYGFPIWLSIIIGGTVSVLFALLISAPIFRMRGVYFAIGTWTVAEILRILFSNWKYVGYGMGLFIKPAYELSFNTIYFAALGVGIGIGCPGLFYSPVQAWFGFDGHTG